MSDNAAPVIDTRDGAYRVSGPLTFDTVGALLPRIDDIERDRTPLTVDLSGVTRADSAGLALLIEWLRAAHRAQRPLVFAHVPAKLQTLIRVSDLEGVLPEQGVS